MAVAPIGSLGPLANLGIPPVKAPSSPTTEGRDFGRVVVDALESLQALHGKADGLAVEAATGDLTDVHDYTIAAAEASLATELTVAVRNRAVEAFNEIMRMQI
ncbi:MAG: flagellar hook-basal body complex protein FliE [Acidimicrobiia bacterium]|nr:flagellar hook-basal body complex protein FliE [Acidimicrobiia bacterium]